MFQPLPRKEAEIQGVSLNILSYYFVFLIYVTCLQAFLTVYLDWHKAKYLATFLGCLLQGDSVLKVQYILDEEQKYRPDGPTDKELAKMFFTTRHPWDPE